VTVVDVSLRFCGKATIISLPFIRERFFLLVELGHCHFAADCHRPRPVLGVLPPSHFLALPHSTIAIPPCIDSVHISLLFSAAFQLLPRFIAAPAQVQIKSI
jgi:hypothetical protein